MNGKIEPNKNEGKWGRFFAQHLDESNNIKALEQDAASKEHIRMTTEEDEKENENTIDHVKNSTDIMISCDQSSPLLVKEEDSSGSSNHEIEQGESIEHVDTTQNSTSNSSDDDSSSDNSSDISSSDENLTTYTEGNEDNVSWIPEEDGSVQTVDAPNNSNPTSNGRGGEFRAQIALLISEVFHKDKADNVDELLTQFEGREEALRDTLQGMNKGENDTAALTKDISSELQQMYIDNVSTPNTPGGIPALTTASVFQEKENEEGVTETKDNKNSRSSSVCGDEFTVVNETAVDENEEEKYKDQNSQKNTLSSEAKKSVEERFQCKQDAEHEGEAKPKKDEQPSDRSLPETPSIRISHNKTSTDEVESHCRTEGSTETEEKSNQGACICKDIDDTSKGDIEEGKPREKNEPSINFALPLDSRVAEADKVDSELSFETHYTNGIPAKIQVNKKAKGAATVVSALPTPRMPTPWWKTRRTKMLTGILFMLLVACGIVLGLFFAGVFDGMSSSDNKESDKNTAEEDVATIPFTEACAQEVSSQFTTFGLDGIPSDYAPKVAVDGHNAVVVTNNGDVKFYSLVDGDTWQEVSSFTNINKGRYTPSIAISGKVVIVGFLYGLDTGELGGVHIFNQDSEHNLWSRGDILLPSDSLDTNAFFGWSLDVDTQQDYPLIVVGAHGDNSVYVFEKSEEAWSQVGKLKPQSCESNFGYAVAIVENVIAATTDCKLIVQLYEYNRNKHAFTGGQHLPYISFDAGAVSELVFSTDYLVYSTVFGGIMIFERTSMTEFKFLEQLDVRVSNITEYPLSLDNDIIAVGVGNRYLILPKKKNGESWNESSYYIQNDEAEFSIPSIAVSGRDLLAGSSTPHEVFTYNVKECTAEAPTSSPTKSISPTSVAVTSSPTSSPIKNRLCHPVEIKILFDNYPFGTGYLLSNVETTESYSFFPVDDLLANQEYIETLCLNDGSYKFVMYDSYGDGICCGTNGNGEYIVTSNGITLAQGGDFTYSDETLFELSN